MGSDYKRSGDVTPKRILNARLCTNRKTHYFPIYDHHGSCKKITKVTHSLTC